MNKNVYIRSIEGAEIYEHMFRNKIIKEEYYGMIPHSLELIKLQKEGLKTRNKSKSNNKLLSDDVINVNFKQKVKSSKEIIKLLNKKITKINNMVETEDNEIKKDKNIKYVQKLMDFIKVAEEKKWDEVKNDDLRKYLYKNGFTIIKVDEETGEILDESKFVVYKRSSAKSRTGQVLFIKEKFRDKMLRWARLGMDLNDKTLDYPSLLSYESLVGSSIEDTIKIDVNNILIVDDVKSVFAIKANLIKKDKNNILQSIVDDNYKMDNDIFDGEGLLDSSYFKQAKRETSGMMLLRQHMFKSCVFNTNIQQFLMDHCPEDSFEDWTIKDMFGDKIKAKDIKMIICPSSLKALKFKQFKKNSKPEMWRHWKTKVEKEDCLFGICKSEHPSKKGYDEENRIINQTSYQMLNSMPISHDTMLELAQFEIDYIIKLKNDTGTYIEYLKETANEMNCNDMLVDLYKKNNEIIRTKIFKDKRKKDINNYVTHVRKGKIRLNGDYLTICGNCIELLYHAIGQLPIENGVLDECKWKDNQILKGNEVYTTQHDFGAEYIGFRNPHTSPSNVLIVKNTYNKEIDKYFNLSKNIIYTNAINFPIQRILSGQDLDSDTLILFNNQKLLEVAKKCYVLSDQSKYKVCVNEVNLLETTKYKVCNEDMCSIDTKLATSQRFIGTVVNLGQLYMSAYWDLINSDYNGKKLDVLLQGVDICTVLSEISIDLAKRMYDVDIEQQIKNLKKCKILGKKKPIFFKYISKNDNLDGKLKYYKCSMDFLYDVMKLPDANDVETLDLITLIKDVDEKKVKTKQKNNILTLANNLTLNTKSIEVEESKEKDSKRKYNRLDEVKNWYLKKIRRYKIKDNTIVCLIKEIYSNAEYKYKMDILNTLYQTNKETFIEAFKQNHRKK